MWLLFEVSGVVGMCLAWLLSSPTTWYFAEELSHIFAFQNQTSMRLGAPLPLQPLEWRNCWCCCCLWHGGGQECTWNLDWFFSSGISFFDAESVSCVAANNAKINEIGCSLAFAATGTKELLMWLLFMTWGRTRMCLDGLLSSPTWWRRSVSWDVGGFEKPVQQTQSLLLFLQSLQKTKNFCKPCSDMIWIIVWCPRKGWIDARTIDWISLS